MRVLATLLLTAALLGGLVDGGWLETFSGELLQCLEERENTGGEGGRDVERSHCYW